MNDRIACFWTESTNKVHQYLRRYRSSAKDSCRGKYGYHNAMVEIGVAPANKTPEGYLSSFDKPPLDDPRWPQKCDHCEYEFVAEDEYQPFIHEIYVRPDTGEEFILGDAPAGAMWDSWWYGDGDKGSDGISLSVQLPDGLPWCVDFRRENATWSRTGTVPNVTARPSILTPKYHGFLTEGYLVSV